MASCCAGFAILVITTVNLGIMELSIVSLAFIRLGEFVPENNYGT
jgi:hypothetical protein